MYAIAGYMQVLLGILFLALIYSAWQLFRPRYRFRRENILPETTRLARGKLISVIPSAILWNENRVYLVKLIILPPNEQPFITEVTATVEGKNLRPIHNGIVIAIENTNQKKLVKVWLRKNGKNRSIDKPYDSLVQNDGSLNHVL
ncbi:MAG: hypothetical protein NVV59_13570 [Chitinophagaceae bacterium]|nr:hypothetical protein [Chitinophagaceae bacterium]